jgi:hypothetical protein
MYNPSLRYHKYAHYRHILRFASNYILKKHGPYTARSQQA